MVRLSKYRPFHFRWRATLWAIKFSQCVSIWRSLQSYRWGRVILLNWEQFPEMEGKGLSLSLQRCDSSCIIPHLHNSLCSSYCTTFHFICLKHKDEQGFVNVIKKQWLCHVPFLLIFKIQITTFKSAYENLILFCGILRKENKQKLPLFADLGYQDNFSWITIYFEITFG